MLCRISLAWFTGNVCSDRFAVSTAGRNLRRSLHELLSEREIYAVERTFLVG